MSLANITYKEFINMLFSVMNCKKTIGNSYRDWVGIVIQARFNKAKGVTKHKNYNDTVFRITAMLTSILDLELGAELFPDRSCSVSNLGFKKKHNPENFCYSLVNQYHGWCSENGILSAIKEMYSKDISGFIEAKKECKKNQKAAKKLINKYTSSQEVTDGKEIMASLDDIKRLKSNCSDFKKQNDCFIKYNSLYLYVLTIEVLKLFKKSDEISVEAIDDLSCKIMQTEEFLEYKNNVIIKEMPDSDLKQKLFNLSDYHYVRNKHGVWYFVYDINGNNVEEPGSDKHIDKIVGEIFEYLPDVSTNDACTEWEKILKKVKKSLKKYQMKISTIDVLNSLVNENVIQIRYGELFQDFDTNDDNDIYERILNQYSKKILNQRKPINLRIEDLHFLIKCGVIVINVNNNSPKDAVRKAVETIANGKG